MGQGQVFVSSHKGIPMPAHIGMKTVLKGTIGFLDQKTGFTQGGVLFGNMHKTTKGRSLGANSYGVSPATVVRLAEHCRSLRERAYASYAEYRAAMNLFDPKCGLNECGYELKSPNVKTLGDNAKIDSKGFQHFKTEWQLHLRPGTDLDRAIEQLFARGWVVTMIMGAEKRNKQLKRLEGAAPGHKHVKILWTLD
jgi:hypothetical protein